MTAPFKRSKNREFDPHSVRAAPASRVSGGHICVSEVRVDDSVIRPSQNGIVDCAGEQNQRCRRLNKGSSSRDFGPLPGLPVLPAGASLAPCIFGDPLAFAAEQQGRPKPGRASKMRRHAANNVGSPVPSTGQVPSPGNRGSRRTRRCVAQGSVAPVSRFAAGDQDYALARGHRPSLC